VSTRLAITACVRDEADILPVHLAYHAALGVSRAYLYLDRCDERTHEVLRAVPWVEVVPVERDVPAQSLEQLQLVCMDDALQRARAEGIAWLLAIDPDEFAWGGPLAYDGAPLVAGNLLAMLARAHPRTEQVVLKTLEALPRRQVPGTPFWRRHAMLRDAPLERDVRDPLTGETVRLRRWLGHDLGKSVVRVAADVQPGTAHRWTRRQDTVPGRMLPLVEETLGQHFHYVVRDAAHWLDKYRKLAIDPDTWLDGAPMLFPKLAWKRAAATMTRDEAEQYYNAWVAVPDAEVAAAKARGVVTMAPHVETVLDAIGWTAPVRSHVPRTTRCRVAFVGIDSADPALVRAWAEAGLLPTFRRLLDGALTAATDPPVGSFVGSLWPSITTAVNPGRHGVHSWEQIVPGTYEVRRFLAGRENAATPFWVPLARAGRRVALLDVPLSGPSDGFDGAAVFEWGGHDPEEGFRTQPPGLAEEIRRIVGMPPVQGNCNAQRDEAAHARFRDDLVTGVRMRTRLHRLLLAREDWDLFFTVYAESHCVGHQAWHLHDPAHAAHDPAMAARVGDPLLDVYRAIDASLADLLARLGEETIVLVFASHGMRPHDDPTHLLDAMLERIERARERGPLRRLLGRAAADVDAPPRAREERAYFALQNNQTDGAIRLNLVGREPAGRIRPGREADAACARLAADLATFVDVDTGEPILDRVVRTRDVCHGPQTDRLPDLWVLWRKSGPTRHVRSRLAGDVVGAWQGTRTGDHTPEGLLMVHAPHVRAGDLGRRLDVMDLAPTLAAMLGVPLADVDGRAIAELLSPASPVAAESA
jgi:predicted AlkP superfamily phosphohydrolase/phosphomutase